MILNFKKCQHLGSAIKVCMHVAYCNYSKAPIYRGIWGKRKPVVNRDTVNQGFTVILYVPVFSRFQTAITLA